MKNSAVDECGIVWGVQYMMDRHLNMTPKATHAEESQEEASTYESPLMTSELCYPMPECQYIIGIPIALMLMLALCVALMCWSSLSKEQQQKKSPRARPYAAPYQSLEDDIEATHELDPRDGPAVLSPSPQPIRTLSPLMPAPAATPSDSRLQHGEQPGLYARNESRREETPGRQPL